MHDFPWTILVLRDAPQREMRQLMVHGGPVYFTTEAQAVHFLADDPGVLDALVADSTIYGLHAVWVGVYYRVRRVPKVSETITVELFPPSTPCSTGWAWKELP